MISLFMMTAHEMASHIAKQAQYKRLEMNRSQKTISECSGVSFGFIKNLKYMLF